MDLMQDKVFAIHVTKRMADFLLSLTSQAAAKGPDAHVLGDLHDGAVKAVEHFKNVAKL